MWRGYAIFGARSGKHVHVGKPAPFDRLRKSASPAFAFEVSGNLTVSDFRR
jgi:hypothetical protein